MDRIETARTCFRQGFSCSQASIRYLDSRVWSYRLAKGEAQ